MCGTNNQPTHLIDPLPKPHLETQSTNSAPDSGAPGSDAALIARAARRDTSAMVALYSRFGSPIFSYALKTLGERRDAEEVVQDALVKIWERAPTYDPGRAKAFTWCFMIARSLCLDRLRRRSAAKRKGYTVSLDDASVAGLSDGSDGVIHTLHLHEELTRVRAALEKLHPAERNCIELSLFGGVTHNDIAASVDEPIGTVKTRIRRGMIKLRRLLAS